MSTPRMIGGCFYGYCPICGDPGVWRERRPNGNDRCASGHDYPSAKAVMPNMEAKPDPNAPTLASIQAELAQVREELASVREELATHTHASLPPWE